MSPDGPIAVPPIAKPIVLVGLMGSGKTSVGLRLAKSLNVPFIDSDQEIEARLGYSISYIFEYQGEAFFRKVERETITELLTTRPLHVLATGGGAFIQSDTRALIKKHAISVWLNADLDVLVERVSRRNNRPLLEAGNKREILETLMKERNPYYAEADLIVDSNGDSHVQVVEAVLEALRVHLS